MTKKITVAAKKLILSSWLDWYAEDTPTEEYLSRNAPLTWHPAHSEVTAMSREAVSRACRYSKSIDHRVVSKCRSTVKYFRI